MLLGVCNSLRNERRSKVELAATQMPTYAPRNGGS
jgi:hypothetical protein